MNLPRRHRLLALALAAVTGLALVGVTIASAGDDEPIPPIKPARLIASMAEALSGRFWMSGEVQTRLDLGLPVVPDGWGGDEGALGLMNGTNRFRVWRSPRGVRLAHVTEASEQVLVANERKGWWWDSVEFQATRVRRRDLLDALYRGWIGRTLASAERSAADVSAAELSDPVRLARYLLREFAPTASVRVRGTTEVAGRPAYRLVMNPRSDVTLVRSVSVAVDVETRLPLRVRVTSSRGGGDPAIEAAFTEVSFDRIGRSMFQFRPPAGAEVVDALDRLPREHRRPRAIRRALRRADRNVQLIGSGFEARWIVRLKHGTPPTLAGQLPYQGPLVSALLVDGPRRDRVLIGPVPLEVLQADADAIW